MNPGVLCLIVPLAAGAGLLAVRAIAAGTRPGKLGSAAAACAVAALVSALLGPAFKDPDQMANLVACGLVTLVLAVAAVGLAVWALRAHRKDPGPVGWPAIAGLVLGAANLFCGAGLLVTGSGALVPTDGTPWTWRSVEHDFEVTIPTEQWVAKPNPNVVADFSCPRPPIRAAVTPVLPAGTEAEYEAVLARGRQIRDDTPTTNTVERTGPNRHGHLHWVYMGDAVSDGKPYFFGVSITRVRGHAVMLMLEGPYRLLSEAGRTQEAKVLRTQAELFLGSVK
jgi:hypothetical protein